MDGVWTQAVKAKAVKAKSLIILVLFMGGLFIQEPLFDCWYAWCGLKLRSSTNN